MVQASVGVPRSQREFAHVADMDRFELHMPVLLRRPEDLGIVLGGRRKKRIIALWNGSNFPLPASGTYARREP